MEDLSILAGFFTESVGGLLGGTILLPGTLAMIVCLVIMVSMVICELRK